VNPADLALASICNVLRTEREGYKGILVPCILQLVQRGANAWEIIKGYPGGPEAQRQ
jgi:hypothetical protein